MAMCVTAVASVNGKIQTLVVYLDTKPISDGSLNYTRRVATRNDPTAIPVAHEIQRLLRELYAHPARPMGGVSINTDNRNTFRLRFSAKYHKDATPEQRVEAFLVLLQEMADLLPTTQTITISEDYFVPAIRGHAPQHEVESDTLVSVLNVLLARRG